MDVQNLLIITGGIITILLSANGFFLSRVFTKMDASEDSMKQKLDDASSSMIGMKAQIQELAKKVSEIPNLTDRVVNLEKDIAVLTYRMDEIRDDFNSTRKAKPSRSR